MKKIALAILVALVVCGCKYCESARPAAPEIRSSEKRGFQPEKYVWENWTFSTNAVPKIVK